MTPLFIAAAIVAAPFVLWFLWRRARPRPDKEDAEAAPAASFSGTADADTATREVPRPPNSSMPVEEAEDVPIELEEVPSAALQPPDAQSLSESGTPLLQVESAILDAAHPESSNAPLVETNETSGMPEEDQPAEHLATAAADGSHREPVTLHVHTTTEVLLSADSALLVETVETEETPGRPEKVSTRVFVLDYPAGPGTQVELRGTPF